MFPLRKLFPTILVAILLVFLFFQANHELVSLRFVDEEDNIALGYFLNRGEFLYQDMFSHHQPLAYIFSSFIQQFSQPNSLYLLLKYHRLIIFVYAATWLLFLTKRFGWPVFLFTLIFEPVKPFFLGNLFLSESLVIYPMLYLFGLVLENKESYSKLELVGIGITFTLCLFLLAPIWPVIFFFGLLLLSKNKFQKQLWWPIVGSVSLTLFTLSYLSIPDYIQQVFYINFFHYIPQETAGDGLLMDSLKSLFTPLISLRIKSATLSLKVIQFLSAGLLLTILGIKKRFSLIILLTLALANIRYIQPGSELYAGFHLLPWFALLVFSVNFIFFRINLFLRIILGVILFITLTYSWSHWLWTLKQPKDIQNSMFVNYSETYSLGRAIQIISNSQDTLLTVPDGWLLYWQGQVGQASKMINYYHWMAEVDLIRGWVETDLSRNKPTFIYCDCDDSFGLESLLQKKYVELKKENRSTHLYIDSNRLESLSRQQKEELEFLSFNLEK